jgi:hypothetical protein
MLHHHMTEPRFNVELMFRVFGMGANLHPFSQQVQACNISAHGARLSGLETQLVLGDIVGVDFAGKKARCQVMNLVDTGALPKIEVGVRLMDGQACPWREEFGVEGAVATGFIPGTKAAAKDQRKFPRHRIPMPVEIRAGTSAGIRMSTNTADIAGNGCYIETRMPFPVNQILGLTLWLNSEPIHTSAIVRTCDGGVGMGIEFTGLDEMAQRKLQQRVEVAAERFAPFRTGSGRLLTSLFSASNKV